MNDRLSAALAAIDEFIAPKNADWNTPARQPDEAQLLAAAKARGLLRGYHAKWENAGYTIYAVEVTLESPLCNPETNRTSRTFKAGGKLDVIAGYNDRRVLFDHKTTSEEIENPDVPYWRQLLIEGQVNHYMLLGWQNGQKFDMAVWDVVRKPGISPKVLTKAQRASIAADGKYFGFKVSDRDRLAVQTEERESLEMYEFRLAHDCTVDRPERYFQRRTVPRIDAELLEYAKELWMHGQDILHTRNENRHVRNSGACMLYGSPCKFLPLCSGHDTPDSERWKKKTTVHRELTGHIAEDRDLLTNSRIRCYQTCRRKHWYEYELGIERVDEEERESLYFGTLWHVALECWFNTFLESENVNSSNEQACSEHATAGAGANVA